MCLVHKLHTVLMIETTDYSSSSSSYTTHSHFLMFPNGFVYLYTLVPYTRTHSARFFFYYFQLEKKKKEKREYKKQVWFVPW